MLYFAPSRINVGARPAEVDMPCVVPHDSQLEQLRILPRYACGCTSTRISQNSRAASPCSGNIERAGSTFSCATYGTRCAWRKARSQAESFISHPKKDPWPV